MQFNPLRIFFPQSPSPDLSHFPDPKHYRKIIPNHTTPFFITSVSFINDRLASLRSQLKKAWGANHLIAYSFKTNYDVARNCSFPAAEVVSSMEYSLAKKGGYSDSRIIFNGPNKQPLHQLANKPLYLNLDHQEEIEKICDRSNKITAQVGLRVNTAIQPSRFGFNIESGAADNQINRLVSSGIIPKGLHLHLGSNIFDHHTYNLASKRLTSFIATTEKRYHFVYKYIDFGGGFPSHGHLPGSPIQNQFNLQDYITSICKPLRNYYPPTKTPQLILELGRFLVDDATLLITQVISQHHSHRHQTITVNATNLMIPSVWYHSLIVHGFTPTFQPNLKPSISTTVYGSSCQESDLLYEGLLSPLKPGDYVVFYAVGAYNQSQSADFIFPSPPTMFT